MSRIESDLGRMLSLTTPDTINELKPCPFCGSTLTVHVPEPQKVFVACSNAGCLMWTGAGIEFADTGAAVKAWNKRPTTPETVRDVAYTKEERDGMIWLGAEACSYPDLKANHPQRIVQLLYRLTHPPAPDEAGITVERVNKLADILFLDSRDDDHVCSGDYVEGIGALQKSIVAELTPTTNRS